MNRRSPRVLVTGGAGFIGSHITDALLGQGYDVTIYDSLDPQVHGAGRKRPDYLHPDVRLMVGDICDRERLQGALEGMEVVYHQAGAVGVAQSMYDILRYTKTNTLGAATLLDIVANEKHTVRKMIVASSMTIYGEGAYRCATHGIVYPQLRRTEQLEQHQWELHCPQCGVPVIPQATGEEKPIHPTSIYAINKRDHEEMFLSIGRAYGIPTVALRYFSVYGPRQALSNPYTGVAAIFSSSLLNGNAPLIYEDGLQSRDFTHISDVVQANLLALEKDEANYQVFNVGTGRPFTICDIARALAEHLGVKTEADITHKFRAGDIRHCYADISKARRLLGYEPKVSFAEGVAELVEWVRHQKAEDNLTKAASELEQRGLAR
ncbi:MAG: NAD-dependent epimerase/dehydratase family protein [Caldilineaceae bacterium]